MNLRDILQSEHIPIDEYITPHPDFKIDFISKNEKTVIVHCPVRREMWEVVQFVKKSRAGDWMAGIWMGEADTGNPFMNGDGLWVYLVRR